MSHRHEQGCEAQEEEGQLRDGVPGANEVGTPEGVPAAQVSCSSSAPTQAILPNEGSCRQAQRWQGTSKAYLLSKFLLNTQLQYKVTELVKFLSFKYTTNQPVTEAEIVKNIVKEHQHYYRFIFKHACECMEVVFGIEVKEVDAINHSYELLKVLDLTYDGCSSDDDELGIPRMGLLVLILGVIFVEGNRAPEKKIWDMLNTVGIYPDQHDFICGNPKKFVTKDLVSEKYLEYQLVPGSDPPCYEFLWGPRAHAEATKMKVLHFFSKVVRSSPTSFAALYKEALKDEEERAQTILATIGNPVAQDDSGSRDKPSSFSRPE